MREDFYYPSISGKCQIHACRWLPEGEVKAVVQIVHGIAEFAARYDRFAAFLVSRGIAVVAEDHMGHGQSINGEGIQGYFHGGWFAAAEDTYALLRKTREEYSDVPYFILGHSMGSLLTRTILCRHPDSGIAAAVICGTAWQPRAMLPAAIKLAEGFCRHGGETNPSAVLQNLVFGTYNRKVSHPRTEFDWLCRDNKQVDAYIADPLCGFVASAGLLRDMMQGILYIEQPENLAHMDKELPVFFIAGGDDPVGNYGKGVQRSADAFWDARMEKVSLRIYPLCRHEILNEINRTDVYADVAAFFEKYIKESTKIG